MNLRTLAVGDLQNYLTSESYRKTAVIPITIQRAISQANNPRANTDDPALIIAEDERGNVAGFIGVLPDLIFHPEKAKVFWISCWWSDPDKGKMLGIPLLLAAYKATEGRLLADSTPDTLSVFLKSKLFVVPQPKHGLKLFLQPLISDVLIRKKPALKPYKFVFQMADRCISAIFAPVNVYRNSINSIPKEIISEYSCTDTNPESDSLFERSKADFDWIMKFPWVIPEDQFKEKRFYPFSSTAKLFVHHQISILKENKSAFLHLTLRDGVVKLHYARIETDLTEIVKKVLLKFLYKVRAKEFISFHEGINTQLIKTPILFCLKYPTTYQYVWGKPLGDLPSNKFQYGDGDAIFT